MRNLNKKVKGQLTKYLAGGGLIAAIAVSILTGFNLSHDSTNTVFDYAFELFGLNSLNSCDGFSRQVEVFKQMREDSFKVTESQKATLELNWSRFVDSKRGAMPNSCEWQIISYPVGFVAVSPRTAIVLNPSNTVLGAPLPEGATGDLIMDLTRYSETSLGAFRGAATIPPRTIAVIGLRYAEIE